jgi:hypothetical protein
MHSVDSSQQLTRQLETVKMKAHHQHHQEKKRQQKVAVDANYQQLFQLFHSPPMVYSYQQTEVLIWL